MTPRRGRRGSRSPVLTALCAQPYVALIVVLGACYLPWIASSPLDDTLEGNRLEAAREMLRSGDWTVPWLGGAMYLSKPPFHPWTLAVASLPFGDVSLASGRIVSALLALATCCLVYRWARRELGARTAFVAALALGTSVLFARKAMRAELECELVLLTTVALFELWNAAWSSDRARAWTLRVVSGLALGGALLAKGPPASIVFVATAITASAASKSRRRAFAISAMTALAVAIASTLAWIVPLLARVGPGAAWDAFRGQFIERIAHAGRTNSAPLWYYAPALLSGLAPAIVLLPCVALVRPGRAQDGERARSRAAFLWGWALVTPILFTLSAGKEARYLLPTFPAWSLLFAWGWTRARTSMRFVGWRALLRRSFRAATWAAPFVWVAAGWRLYPESRGVVVATAAGLLLFRVAVAWSARVARPWPVLATVALSIATAKLAWANTALASRQREAPTAEIGRAIAARLAPGEAWTLLGPYRSWLHFAVNRPCHAAASWSELFEARAIDPSATGEYVLAPEASIEPDEHRIERLGRWTVDGEPYCLARLSP